MFRIRVSGESLSLRVTGNEDPGYAGTAKMLGESALALALDKEQLPSHYGILTPSVAMGEHLVARLNAAGIRFSIG